MKKKNNISDALKEFDKGLLAILAEDQIKAMITESPTYKDKLIEAFYQINKGLYEIDARYDWDENNKVTDWLVYLTKLLGIEAECAKGFKKTTKVGINYDND